MNTVTSFTQKILESRAKDDFRIGFITDIMFGDDFGGSKPERKFEFEGDNGKKETLVLRKARPMDSFQYLKLASYEDTVLTIENNIQNIQRLKRNGSGMQGMPPINNVWVIIFTIDENDNISMNSYLNPDANDCSDIIKSKKTICFTSFIIEYKLEKEIENLGSEVLEFTFMSPMDENNINEYKELALQQEINMLENTFFIKFDKNKIEH